ncbi:MAG: hypothetical protein HY903_02290 [Deltaproteobacteria bacterium]|nr:hypothetical protein [Deltaproteobacteria bacterium]
MKNALFLVVGFAGVTFWSAVAAKIRVAHLVPDAAIVTVVFLALRRDPLLITLTALTLGYLVGRECVAPVGLHETALVGCAVSVYLASGALTGSGPLFFAVVCGGATIGYQLLLFVLLFAFRGTASFPGWPTMLLLPSAVATGLLALLSYGGLNALDRRLAADHHEALSWR